MEPQSLADASRDQVRQDDRRSGERPGSVAEAADRVRDQAWFAWVRKAAQPAGAGPSIVGPTREVGRDQRPT